MTAVNHLPKKSIAFIYSQPYTFIVTFAAVRKQRKTVVLEKILVQDYAAEGKSLARVDGKVIFIEGAVPGDVVDVLLSKNKNDWAEGHTIKIHSLSYDRVTPFCKDFGVCG